jgi:hypothetical protein
MGLSRRVRIECHTVASKVSGAAEGSRVMSGAQ